MSAEPLDIYEYRAALLEWHQANVGQSQLIFVAENSHILLQNIRDDVLRYANSLTHHYAQVIDAMDERGAWVEAGRLRTYPDSDDDEDVDNYNDDDDDVDNYNDDNGVYNANY